MADNSELRRVRSGKLQVFYKAWAGAHIGVFPVGGVVAKLLYLRQIGQFAVPIGGGVRFAVATVKTGFGQGSGWGVNVKHGLVLQGGDELLKIGVTLGLGGETVFAAPVPRFPVPVPANLVMLVFGA